MPTAEQRFVSFPNKYGPYAVTDQTLKINTEKKVISLNLQIDTDICSMYEYFEIFLQRMLMCRGAADMLGATFKLTANGAKVL